MISLEEIPYNAYLNDKGKVECHRALENTVLRRSDNQH